MASPHANVIDDLKRMKKDTSEENKNEDDDTSGNQIPKVGCHIKTVDYEFRT